MNFSTPFSTNAVSICKSAGLDCVTRVEYSLRYLIKLNDGKSITEEQEEALVASLHDRMTQCRYVTPPESFDLEKKSEEVFEVEVMREGRPALERANTELGNNLYIFASKMIALCSLFHLQSKNETY